MRTRRKQNACLNCGAELNSVYNYCPLCGQENTDNKVSFKTLITDFFSNYLSFDSRFAKSINPFLFKPGYLTNEFINGHRVSFMHPIRLYLVMSLFYFFIISLPGRMEEEVIESNNIEFAPEQIVFQTESDSTNIESLKSLMTLNDSVDLVSESQVTSDSTEDSDNENFWINS